MIRRVSTFFLALTALAVVAVSASATPNSSSAIKASFDVTAAAKVGSTTLAPGHYEVTVDGTQAKFTMGSKTVAEVPCTVKDLSSKAHQTGFSVDNNQITEIQISGKTQAIEFSTPTSGN